MIKILPVVQNKNTDFKSANNKIPFKSLNNSNQTTEKKVDFKEGINLIGKGFLSQGKNLLTSIIKHPVRTIATTAITSGVLLALPLIGIPTAVGGGFLTLGFAGFSIFNLAKNIKEAKENNDKQDYSKAQDSFKKIGNSIFDVALTLPFAPKAVKEISEFAKYGKVGINSTLISNFKQEKGFKKLSAFQKANQEFKRSYTYQAKVDKALMNSGLDEARMQQAKKILLQYNVEDEKIIEVTVERLKREKGISIDIPIKKEQTESGKLGNFSPDKCEITIKDRNLPDLIKPKNSSSKIAIKKIHSYDSNHYRCEMYDIQTGKRTADQIIRKDIYDSYIANSKAHYALNQNAKDISVVTHEYEHFDQWGKIMRMEGTKLPKFLTKEARARYSKLANTQGIIPKNSPEYQVAKRYAKHIQGRNYSTNNAIEYILNEREIGARLAQDILYKQDWFKIYNTIDMKDLKKVNMLADYSIAQVQANDLARK